MKFKIKLIFTGLFSKLITLLQTTTPKVGGTIFEEI